MKKYFTVFLAFIIYFNVFSQAHAAKNYKVKTIYYDPLEKVINATVLDQIAEKTMRRSAKVPVTASATGSTVASMIRMGIAGAAIYGLVEGVGWIIENGVVKKLDPSNPPDFNSQYYWTFEFRSGKFSSLSAACPKNINWGGLDYIQRSPAYTYNSETYVRCNYADSRYPDLKNLWVEGSAFREDNPNYNPEIKPKYVPVPDTEIGDKVNNSPQAPQILPTVYNPNNPAGGKAPQATSDALDRAVPVPETDPEGSTTVDPETGKGTFKLPAFCEWASVMCAWYEKYQDDSKKTDQHREQEKDVWSQEKIARDEEKTARQEEKQHRDDEKTFWEKVTDWFDWTKEEPDDKEEPEQPEIDDKGIFSRTFDTVFSLSKQCPPDLPWSIDAYYFKGSYSINLNWLCMIFTFLGYPLVLASHCVGLWIMYEAVIRKEIKW